MVNKGVEKINRNDIILYLKKKRYLSKKNVQKNKDIF